MQGWRPFVKWSVGAHAKMADVSELADVLSRCGNPSLGNFLPHVQVLGSLSSQQVAIDLANFKKLRFLVV